MKKCCFIIPYFGKLPNYFPLFLKTCKWNTDFNWLVFTDDKQELDYPENVFVIYMTFENLRQLVNSKFDFQVSLATPYKLCDFKPAYGYIFEEYLKDYKFWGHCDIDTLMGHLSNFITDEMLDNYDKIFCLGHLILYKNTFSNNRCFMSKYKGEWLYKDVFSCNNICFFDEESKDENNINQIFIDQGKSVFMKDLSLNITKLSTNFLRTEYVGRSNDYPDGFRRDLNENVLYLWDNGNVCRLHLNNGRLCRDEFAYIHLQKRKMKYSHSILACDRIKIIPHSFCPLEVDDITVENFNSLEKTANYCTKLNYNCIRLKRRIVRKLQSLVRP